MIVTPSHITTKGNGREKERMAVTGISLARSPVTVALQ